MKWRLGKKDTEEQREGRRIIFLRRGAVVGIVTALAAVGIFCAVLFPASTAVSTTERQLPIYSVERAQKLCSISFDAAWGNEDTQLLIDTLAKYNVKTTFFVVGDWVDKYPESVKALSDAGHEVMNHSNRHDHYNSLTTEEIIADVTACNEKIAAVTGVTPTLIRCPYGEYDDHVISAIRSMGMEPVQWDVDVLETTESHCGAAHKSIDAASFAEYSKRQELEFKYGGMKYESLGLQCRQYVFEIQAV